MNLEKRTINIQRLFLAALIVLLAPVAFADSIVAIGQSVAGSAAVVSGAPGETVGWGYTITNTSAYWLVTTQLDAGGFFTATPTAGGIFDFPAIAPSTTPAGQSLTVGYTPGSTGLYEITFKPDAIPGTSDVGTFDLSYQYFNGDPAAGGTAIDQQVHFLNAHYEADVASAMTPVPEPSSIVLLLTSLGGLTALRRRLI